MGHSAHAGLTRSALRYALDGTITIDAANRLTTTITTTDAADGTAGSLDDTYTGEASFLLGVPRDQRHATGTSQERYRLSGPRRYDHTIRTMNGTVISG